MLVLGINLVGDGLRNVLGAEQRLMATPLLEVDGLDVTFGGAHGRGARASRSPSTAARPTAWSANPGCGKSVTALAMMNLLPRSAASAPPKRLRSTARTCWRCRSGRWRDLRGNRMAMIFQEPMTSLNPAYTIGSQLTEVLPPPQGRAAAAGASIAPSNCSARSASPRPGCGSGSFRISSPAACASA